MWTLVVFPLLLCVFTPGHEAAGTCAACTDTYDTAGTDDDCGHLKAYLDCLETAAGTSAGCDLSTAQATKIKDATCNAVLDSPCSCQKTFWGSDLSGNNACGPLETYIQCLTDAGDEDTCKAGVIASDIIDKPKGRLAALTCSPEPAGTCAACTTTYDLATTDVDCGHLKTYLDCLETAAGTSAGCDLSTAQATTIKDATCDPVLVSPCTCQQTFWGSDLSGNNACGPLETYIQCLTDAGDKDTCETGVIASDIIDKPQGRLAALTCNTAVSTLGMYSTSVLLPFVLMTFFC